MFFGLSLFTIVVWVIIGLFIGWIASLIVGEHIGFFGSVVAGVLGSFLGGYIARFFGISPEAGLLNFLFAVLGAVIVLILGRIAFGGGK